MLRRGLHGAKNWVLEPEPGGTARSPLWKAVRLAVVLIPVWIVFSAFMEPSGQAQRLGFPQAVFMAFVVALAGAGFFSARERRLGREEPWLDLPPIATEGDELERTKVLPSVEEGAVEAGKEPQVSDVDASSDRCNWGDFSGMPDDTGQSDYSTLREYPQQAISAEAPTLVAQGMQPHATPLRDERQQAILPDPNDDVFDLEEALRSEARTEVLHPAPYDQATVQVGGGFGPLLDSLEGPEQKNMYQDNEDATESDRNWLDDEPTVPLRPKPQTLLQNPSTETPSVQVGPPSEALPQPLQGALQVEYAQRGPYTVGDEPEVGDWWLTKPDTPPQTTEEAGVEKGKEAVQTKEEPPPSTVGEPMQGPQQDMLPAPVVLYLASQSGAAFTDNQKKAAQAGVVKWVHEEVASGRLSQAEAARLIGVHKSTIGRWLNPDPWAD
jgi:hypothetical protein